MVLKSCGEPTLLSVYLQFAARLLWVRGAGVREGAEGAEGRPGERLADAAWLEERVGRVAKVLQRQAIDLTQVQCSLKD